MALLPQIVCLVVILQNVQSSIGLTEGARGVSWNFGGDIANEPGKVISELGGDVRDDIKEFVKEAGHIGGDIAKATGQVVDDVGKGVEHIAGDIGQEIENGAETIIDGAKGAIDGIENIVEKLSPKKKENHKNKHHDKNDGSHEEHKHKKGNSGEKHHSSEEKHGKHHEKKDDKRGHKHHNRHTGRGIDGRSGIGSRDGIKTPILDLLGLSKSVCKVSYAAETFIEDLGELHVWADKQLGIVEHAAVNYIIDNFVLKAVDAARQYHNKIVDFVIDAHIGIQTLVTNTIIEVYRITKAPIRELFACH